ncbi:MAG: LysR family transcriptional regulator [Actinobacteria bacterium]|nr:MAG: LysR family transcriptional regulator [Actinomycetota bacterium]
MDLEDLAAVRAVVDQGTFSAAAVSLKVAQPALSRRIARLERELGGLLFDRLPRHAAPTPLGDAVASAAAAILNEVESARADAMAIARGAAGRIRMSSLAGGIPALARGLSLFQQRHPEVVVELRALDAEAAVLALRERRVDLATLPGSAVEPGLRSRKLARWRVVLAVRPDHPFASRRAIPISALEDQPLLMLAPEFMVSRHVMDLAERTGVRLQPRLRDASPEAVLSLARRAWGIGVLPDSVRIPAELVSVPLARAGASAEFDYVIAWLADRTLPAAAAALVQTLVKETAAFRAG